VRNVRTSLHERHRHVRQLLEADIRERVLEKRDRRFFGETRIYLFQESGAHRREDAFIERRAWKSKKIEKAERRLSLLEGWYSCIETPGLDKSQKID
jgi:hypothetical protein